MSGSNGSSGTHKPLLDERALVTAALDHELALRFDVIDAMNELCARLGRYLRRWIGDAGWHGLLSRSLAEIAHGEPPPLVLGADSHLRWTLDGGAALARHACIEVLAALVRALSRVIGADLASRLIEQGFAAGDDPE